MLKRFVQSTISRLLILSDFVFNMDRNIQQLQSSVLPDVNLELKVDKKQNSENVIEKNYSFTYFIHTPARIMIKGKGYDL